MGRIASQLLMGPQNKIATPHTMTRTPVTSLSLSVHITKAIRLLPYGPEPNCKKNPLASPHRTKMNGAAIKTATPMMPGSRARSLSLIWSTRVR
mmetsp:Transcript_5244/g.12346  ORF Transcript_5244/g.12346 Transcript_5244/m.12346 type:complete len:94 (+) Transcript_5244:205-486(+)